MKDKIQKKELRSLMKMAKKIIKKETLKKIKSIPQEEQVHALKFSLISYFKNEFHDLNIKIKNLENKKNDLFFIKNDLILVPSKIKHFAVDYNSSDFYKLSILIQNIKKELENVIRINFIKLLNI